MTEPTFEELTAEVETLRTQYSELQGALKQSRARVKELEAADADGVTEVKRLRAEVLDLKLHKPVAGLLDSVLVGSKYSAQELADHYRFELSDTGEIEMRDLEGKPITITEKADGKEITRPLRFDGNEVHRYLAEIGKFDHILKAFASGGGAGHGYASAHMPTTQAPERKVAGTGFGLK